MDVFGGGYLLVNALVRNLEGQHSTSTLKPRIAALYRPSAPDTLPELP